MSCRFRTGTRPGRNRARVSKSKEPVRGKNEVKRARSGKREVVRDVSVDGSSSSYSSSCSLASVKTSELRPRRRASRGKFGKGGCGEVVEAAPVGSVKRRCGWITPNSDQLYVSFHDEEWGVPVHDDRKLFELLTFSAALAELSWPTILNKRDAFRELFDKFDPALVASFSEKKILSLKSSGNCFLSDLKLRAVVDKARQLLKVAEEFGSFNCYCWSFVNNKPIVNGFRYPRQVSVKTPKAEAISKDLIRRGFHCVGPTVVYSFMQAAGIVNDHLCSCFRHKECSRSNTEDSKPSIEQAVPLAEIMDNSCSLDD